MEGQFYLMGIAGLAVSLAGFASLLTVFRPPHTWDGVTLWRARIIVRASLDTASAALIPVPVFYLTGSVDWAIRAGVGMILVLSILSTLRSSPARNPDAWPEPYSVKPFYVMSAVAFLVMIVALVLANLGLLLLLLLFELGLPASTFATVVDEYRPQRATATGSDAEGD
jgi:hypothetical protein